MGAVTRVIGIVLLSGALLLLPAPLLALTSGDQFLHSSNGKDSLDTTAPTATQAKFRDSPGIDRKAFKAIGTWAATTADAALKLTAVSDLHVWLGLVNSDDQGTNFDLRIELLKNGTAIASGETKNIQGVTRNPDKAKEITVTFGTIADMQVAAGDVLALRISAKVTDQGGHSNAVGLRLYYDASSRLARFGATFSTPPPPPQDKDGDGFTPAQGDCDDTNPAIHPGATEICNGIDDNCNGQVDEGLGTLSCGVGACARTVAACVNGKPQQCVPGTPSPEVCNGLDDNCNGQIDEGVGQPVTCGVGACAHTVSTCTNGHSQECVPAHPQRKSVAMASMRIATGLTCPVSQP